MDSGPRRHLKSLDNGTGDVKLTAKVNDGPPNGPIPPSRVQPLLHVSVSCATREFGGQIGPGDCFHITPRMKHRMIAIEECDVLEVSTPELDDVVRLEDRYGRVKS